MQVLYTFTAQRGALHVVVHLVSKQQLVCPHQRHLQTVQDLIPALCLQPHRVLHLH